MRSERERVGYRVGTGVVLSLAVFVLWVHASLFASALHVRNGTCDKIYPIDRYFITNLFCEIKQGERDGLD